MLLARNRMFPSVARVAVQTLLATPAELAVV
jgi:hypothetical protein